VQRIVDLRLSPLYISVHATDPVLRHFLLGSPKTIKGDLMERLRRLADAGIRLHTQIVLCPGLNDGRQLERTVRELGALHPGVATVAVVPVGLTRHRDGLYPLRSITAAEASAALDAIHAWQGGFLARHGTRLVFAADELYLQAGRAVPPAAAYEGFSVVEDGVGLVRRFEDDFRRLAGRPGRSRWRGERVATVVTGELFGPILRPLLDRLRVPGLRVETVAVPNEFFGRAITVAGLLTGQDVARALTGCILGDVVLVPRVALTETKGVFLDDVAPEDLARHLGVAVSTVEASARGLVDGLLGRTPTTA
jgi:putative radical SAM enzyme (TIGR03279 family)